MWEEIKNELKQKLKSDEYNFWIDTIKEANVENNILYLTVPSDYYISEIEKRFSKIIKKVMELTSNTDTEPQICYKVNCEMYDTIPISTNRCTTKKVSNIKTWQKLQPNFYNHLELEECLKKSEDIKIESLECDNILEMTPKYSSDSVVSLGSIGNEYFTYSTDKRKSAIVDVKYNFTDEKSMIYKLYRGVEALGIPAVGQLTTNHARVFFAVIHAWQKNGCKFNISKDQAVVNFSLRQLIKDLGYSKVINGTTYKLIYSRIKDLVQYPYVLSPDGINGFGFTYFSSINTLSNKNDFNKLQLRLTFNPFISRQLAIRRVFYRNPNCYLIRNAIALKFLLAYDRTIFKGNGIKKTIQDVASNLEIPYKRQDVLLKALDRALKTLNRYEIDEQYNLKVKLIKENKQYFIEAERIERQQLAFT
ncbi:hypothetical protein AGMMS49593_09630 [Endomicrobiia bacterium]|nr:hypothetical protein AGMMS49593_09630 [Endomicrobiia bacterium]